MFGHNDQQHSDNQPTADGSLTHDDQSTTAPQVNDTAGEFLDDITPPSTPPPITQPDTVTPDAGVTLPSPASDDDADDSTTTPTTVVEPTAPAATPQVAAPSPATAAPNTDALLDIKQQALQQLTPLIGHLEQTPEEKFRTTMMMIQAADNHELLNAAYEAAQQITDEKVRAQALLDIVNEINYFTHNANNGGQDQQQ